MEYQLVKEKKKNIILTGDGFIADFDLKQKSGRIANATEIDYFADGEFDVTLDLFRAAHFDVFDSVYSCATAGAVHGLSTRQEYEARGEVIETNVRSPFLN